MVSYETEAYNIKVEQAKLSSKEVGILGEAIAANYLVKTKQFQVIDRNYWRKWGELDLVTRETSGKIHFVEVKSVSYETRVALEEAVLWGTWRPEEQVHQFKLRQIHKALETWIADNNYEGDWQIDVAAVRIVPRERFAMVKLIENV